MKIIENSGARLDFKLESLSGVYFLKSLGKIVYIGQSINVFNRIFSNHIVDKVFDEIDIHWLPKKELRKYERQQIEIHRPPLNDIEQKSRIRHWERINSRFK